MRPIKGSVTLPFFRLGTSVNQIARDKVAAVIYRVLIGRRALERIDLPVNYVRVDKVEQALEGKAVGDAVAMPPTCGEIRRMESRDDLPQ